jgi:hypothetical protein
MIDQRFIEDLAQDLVLPREQEPEMQLASANTGVTTDGGAFVGYRMNMPKGLNTRENQAKQSVLIADTLAGAGKGMVQGFVGLPGDLESIGRMALGYLGYNVDENTKLPTSEEIGKRLESVLGPVVPQGQTTGVPTEERVRAAEGGELGGELLAPGGQVKLAKKVIKATKDLPVGMSIKMLDGTEEVLEQAPKITTKAFKNWFGDSKAVDDAGKPVVMYHGTGGDFEEFRRSFRGAIFVTPDPDFAESFTGLVKGVGKGGKEFVDEQAGTPVIMPLYVKATNPFDYENPKDVERVIEHLHKTRQFPGVQPGWFEGGKWDKIEDRDVQKAIKDLGYDSFYVEEGGIKNLGVYDPRQVKSAIANEGTFDPKNPSILKGVGVGGTGAAMSQEENK